MENEKRSQSSDLAEVYGDVVSIKELLAAIAICAVLALGAYIIAPNEEPLPLVFGFGGVILGFLICTFLFKPKRHVKDENGERL